ncbi:MAG: DUF1343 domain-containing protein [Lentisphaerae bacterium]|nr:DUF1343 domain-containing protein [Lentisphaerota bacterium]
MTAPHFQPGLDVLLRTHAAWIRGRRLALVSHPAAVDACGAHAVERLISSRLPRSLVIWGPEHGFLGEAGAGELVPYARHPVWKLPVYSLYGAQRKPTPAMLRGIDAIVVDLQDIAVRCYTFVSTLRYVMEAAADARLPLIVADRPVPFPNTVDGPMLDPAQASFVGAIPAPLVYGMTPAETALWLQRTLNLDLDLRLAAMRGYHRDAHRGGDWPPWIPPSPGIATWESAWCYPATVLTEALPAIECGRTTRLPFQSLAAPWIKATPFATAVRAAQLPGLAVHPHVTRLRLPPGDTRLAEGIRLTVTDPARYRPALTAITLLHILTALYGSRRLWRGPSRPEFFDKLMGTSRVREDLAASRPPRAIAADWMRATAAFHRTRSAALLYGSAP